VLPFLSDCLSLLAHVTGLHPSPMHESSLNAPLLCGLAATG
jgi:hypothetical protein